MLHVAVSLGLPRGLGQPDLTRLMFCHQNPQTIAVQCYAQASTRAFLLLAMVKTSRAWSQFVMLCWGSRKRKRMSRKYGCCHQWECLHLCLKTEMVSNLQEQSWLWTNLLCSGKKEFPFSDRTRSWLQVSVSLCPTQVASTNRLKASLEDRPCFCHEEAQGELSCSQGAWPGTSASSCLFTYMFLSSFWHLLQVSPIITLWFG